MTPLSPLERRLTERLGLAPRAAWRRQLPNALAELGGRLRLSPAELERRLLTDPAGLDGLASHLVVSESYFFRHPEQLAQLVIHLRARRTAAPTDRVAVWSAGCARGEEIYSVGLALAAAFGVGAPQWISLRGTDISTAAIDRARQGRFPGWSWRRARAPQPHVSFLPDGEVVLASWLRDWVEFDTALVSDRARTLPDDHLDAILFRNVGIYLTEEALRETYAALSRVLRPDGLLFIAPTDPPPRGFTLFPGTTAVFSKPGAADRHHPTATLRGALESTPTPARPRAPPPDPAMAVRCAMSHLVEGRYGAASDELRRATTLSPDDPLLRYWHAFALTRGGLRRRAELQLNALFRLLSTREPAALLEDAQTTVGELWAAAEQLRSEPT